MVLSCPDAMAKVLQNVTLTADTGNPVPAAGACPECGSGLAHEEGCLICHQCGYSKCS
jgi:ribonucleoside-diphosphate reductase alpha chain